MNVVFDTNVWVALFDKDDIEHEKAVLGLVSVSAADIVIIPEQVFVEVINVLVRNAGKTIADGFVREVWDNNAADILFSDSVFLSDVIKQFLSQNTKALSFVDTTLLLLANDHNYNILTFDRALARAIGKTQRS